MPDSINLTRPRPQRPLVASMLVYLAVFVLVMLTIPRFLFLNQHGFRFPLFACAVMTAFALAYLQAKWARGVLVAIALPGLLFCYAKLHDNRASMASMTLGRWVGANTKPYELLFSPTSTT